MFRINLCNSLERVIDTIRIISIFGDEITFSGVNEACSFIAAFNENISKPKFYGFEILVRYSNGDKLEARYAEKCNAISFLKSIGH